MFEKEAEKYLRKRLQITEEELEAWKKNNGKEVKFVVDCYIEGAEFGYNKCKEELEKENEELEIEK